jgi:hypothetical protein
VGGGCRTWYVLRVTAVRARIRVSANGRLEAEVPPTIPPGEHTALIVIEGREERRPGRVADLIIFDGPWPDGFSLRREDMYGDDGR